MNTISFDSLLFQTAFCCMASDGHIDQREIDKIQSLCEASPLFRDFDFLAETNRLVEAINEQGKDLISNYLDTLESYFLTEEEELSLIDFAVQVIRADEKIEYTEIKFFKTIRHRLKVSDERILEKFPDIEQFLEKDIDTGSFNLQDITKQYLEITDLPQFAPITATLDFKSFSSTTLNREYQTIDPQKFQFIDEVKV